MSASIERQTNKKQLVTVLFDREDDYVMFFELASTNAAESHWTFTNVPILTSLQVASEFFEAHRDEFGARLVTSGYIEKARMDAQARSRRAFDPKAFDNRYVPGTSSSSRKQK